MKETLLAMLPFVIIPPLLIFGWAAIQRRRHPPTQEAMDAAKLLVEWRWLPSGWIGLAFSFAYMGVYALRRYVPLPGVIKLAVLLVPAVVLAWFAYTIHREVRKGDEMEQRIHLDALHRGFSNYMCFALAMWVMRELDPTPSRGTLEMSLVFLPLYYFFGLFTAKASYMPNVRSDHEKR